MPPFNRSLLPWQRSVFCINPVNRTGIIRVPAYFLVMKEILSGSDHSSGEIDDAKILGAAVVGGNKTGHQNGVPLQSSFNPPS